MRPYCRHCALPSLPGFVGDRGFCRFHWAGQLNHIPGSMPTDMRAEWLAKLASQSRLRLAKEAQQ